MPYKQQDERVCFSLPLMNQQLEITDLWKSYFHPLEKIPEFSILIES